MPVFWSINLLLHATIIIATYTVSNNNCLMMNETVFGKGHLSCFFDAFHYCDIKWLENYFCVKQFSFLLAIDHHFSYTGSVNA